jgi:hypothetical protein
MLLGIGLLAAATTLTFADRTEVRGRDTSGSVAGTDESGDVETDPEIRLRVRANHDNDEFQLYYTPRLILSHFAYDLCGPSTTSATVPGATASCHALPNIGATYVNSPTPEILNGGGVSMKHVHKRTAIAFIEQGTYGTVDAGSLLNEPLWTGTDAPPPIFPIARFPDIQLELVTSYAGVSFYEQVTPRIDFQANVSFGVYGGPNNQSRATFPLTESPGLQLKVEDAMTRRDDFIVSAGADYTSVTTYTGLVPGYAASAGAPVDVAPASPQYSVRGYGEARVRHHWSRLAATELAVGGVMAFQQEQLASTNPAVTSIATPYPTAEFLTTVSTNPTQPAPNLGQQPTVHGQLIAIARVQPWIDIFDGTVVQRAEAVLGAFSTVGTNTYRAEVVGHYVIPTDASPGRYRFLYGEVDYAHQMNRTVSVDFGARGGAEAIGEVYSCTTSTAGCAGMPSNANTSGTIYEGELFIGLSWRPLPVKL